MASGDAVSFDELDERIRRIRDAIEVLEDVAHGVDVAHKDKINAARWLLEASGALNKHLQVRLDSREFMWRRIREALSVGGKLYDWLVARGWKAPDGWTIGEKDEL